MKDFENAYRLNQEKLITQREVAYMLVTDRKENVSILISWDLAVY